MGCQKKKKKTFLAARGLGATEQTVCQPDRIRVHAYPHTSPRPVLDGRLYFLKCFQKTRPPVAQRQFRHNISLAKLVWEASYIHRSAPVRICQVTGLDLKPSASLRLSKKRCFGLQELHTRPAGHPTDRVQWWLSILVVVSTVLVFASCRPITWNARGFRGFLSYPKLDAGFGCLMARGACQICHETSNLLPMLS